jgi:hypothetical protein
VAEQKGTPRDIEKEIGELEERVDRLRALYEQYFLGFEKLEPAVPRKDVDRRFMILRKENIRNTALRYRFNVVNQKYNTYAMHWTRICRQIEEGTFKRHVKKAQERFGDTSTAAAARRRAREEVDKDFDVDIDFEDLDATNMDDVLAEADRAASKYERAPIDTLPPGSGPASRPTPPPGSAPRQSPSSPIDRVARPVALPAGKSGPKLIRKIVKGPDSAPDSAPTPAPQTAPTPPPQPAPAARPHASPSGSIRGPMPSAPQIRPMNAPGPQSERRLPVPAAPPSDRRMPAAATPPGAPPAPLSERRLPVPPAGGPARPMIRPAIRPASPSKPDLGEVEDRPSQQHLVPKPGPHAPVPAPSRPRAPLPLPSQTGRDEKK